MDQSARRESNHSELLAGIHNGDREAMARFLLRAEPLIRRRIAGKLGARMRRVFDSQDILSTVMRRIDLYMHEHEIHAKSEQELLGLVMKIANAAVIDKVRLVDRLRKAESEYRLAQVLSEEIDRPEVDNDALDSVLARAFEGLDDPADQRMLWMWLNGLELQSIGIVLEMKPAAVRKRWQRMRQSLAHSINSD